MTTPEILQIATLIVAISAGLGVPVMLRALNKQDVDRATLKEEIHSRYNHLDRCIDELKEKVLGEAATRADIAAMRAEHNAMLTAMRASISNETHGLHQRIMRVESKMFGFTAAD